MGNTKRKREWLRKYHWPKGVSGNPGGRPKKAPFTDVGRELAEATDPKTGKTFARLAVEALFEKVLAGDIQAFQELVNRIEGKATVRIEHSGPEGGNINLALPDVQRRLAELLAAGGYQSPAARTTGRGDATAGTGAISKGKRKS